MFSSTGILLLQFYFQVEGHSKEKCTSEGNYPVFHSNAAVMGIRNLISDLRKRAPNLSRNTESQEPPEADTMESLIQFRDLGMNYITNIGGFKKTLKAYPNHVIRK